VASGIRDADSSASVAPVAGARLELLRALGFAALEHDSHVPFLAYLCGTRRLLAAWGARPAICDAGLFQSVYGTEYVEPDRTADRDDVIAVIGAHAERMPGFGAPSDATPSTSLAAQCSCGTATRPRD
jgi:hypothetical protein